MRPGPGEHLTYVVKYASVVADKMKRRLDGFCALAPVGVPS